METDLAALNAKAKHEPIFLKSQVPVSSPLSAIRTVLQALGQ